MKTTVTEMSQNRRNNFAIIRFIAALMVIAGHMGSIAGTPIPQFLGNSMHVVGVYTLFTLGGYLITKSWLSDPHPLRYGIKRFFRIWPPLAVYVLVTVFIVGPMVSDLGSEGYFSSWYAIYLDNLRLKTVYSLPGVFSENPYPNVVNGALWTLPVEAAMYVIVPILLTAAQLTKNKKWTGILLTATVVFVCFLDCWFLGVRPQQTAVFYGIDWIAALRLIPFYLIGMLYGLLHLEKYLNLQVAVVVTAIVSCLELPVAIQHVVLFFLLPYLIFSLGLHAEPIFALFCRKGEISYGMYLYGFLIQQLVAMVCVQNGWHMDYNVCLIVCVILSVAVAKLSSILVEKPMQNVSRKLLGWLEKSGKADKK